MKKNPKTNGDFVRNLIADLENTPYEVGLALLRERLLLIAEITLDDIKRDPLCFDSSIFNSGHYTDLANRINLHCKFEE